MSNVKSNYKKFFYNKFYKKMLFFKILLLLFIFGLFISSIPIGESAIYTVFDNLSKISTCGIQPPDSLLGYGAVTSWPFIFTCDNVPDGICPEDFADTVNTSIYGSCLSCTDPDCTGIIEGYVFDERGSNYPVDKALVKSNPIKWNISAPDLDNSTYTNPDGYYRMRVTTGKYYFTASKETYDTEVKEAVVLRNNVTYLNFSLVNGTCHDDCTNSYGRCSANCDGLQFNNNATNCSFYDDRAKKLCDLRMKGTTVLYEIVDQDTAKFIDCCEGTPYSNYYSQATISSNNIKSLIKVEKIAKYNDLPVRVVVAYWTPVIK